jgi:hypothetical protein
MRHERRLKAAPKGRREPQKTPISRPLQYHFPVRRVGTPNSVLHLGKDMISQLAPSELRCYTSATFK